MRTYRKLPSQEFLQKHFDYDPNSGSFLWKELISPHDRHNSIGGRVGTVKSSGHSQVVINSVLYIVPRLIWMYHYGVDPGDSVVDHKNRNPKDNSINNLRLLKFKGNTQNVEGRGWSLTPHGRYRASIRVNKKLIDLGTYASADEARNAYLTAKRKYHPTFFG